MQGTKRYIQGRKTKNDRIVGRKNITRIICIILILTVAAVSAACGNAEQTEEYAAASSNGKLEAFTEMTENNGSDAENDQNSETVASWSDVEQKGEEILSDDPAISNDSSSDTETDTLIKNTNKIIKKAYGKIFTFDFNDEDHGFSKLEKLFTTNENFTSDEHYDKNSLGNIEELFKEKQIKSKFNGFMPYVYIIDDVDGVTEIALQGVIDVTMTSDTLQDLGEENNHYYVLARPVVIYENGKYSLYSIEFTGIYHPGACRFYRMKDADISDGVVIGGVPYDDLSVAFSDIW